MTFGLSLLGTLEMSDADEQSLLAQSTKPEFIFGTDDDAMGSPEEIQILEIRDMICLVIQ